MSSLARIPADSVGSVAWAIEKTLRTKAKRLIAASQKLVQTYGGHVPPSMAELLTTTGMYGTGSGPTDRFG
jgi:endonuclease III